MTDSEKAGVPNQSLFFWRRAHKCRLVGLMVAKLSVSDGKGCGHQIALAYDMAFFNGSGLRSSGSISLRCW